MARSPLMRWIAQHDKVVHLAMGLGAAVFAWALAQLGQLYGAPAAAAVAGVVLGAAYELDQWARGSGVPSAADAIATAAPGLAWFAVALAWPA